MTVWTVPAVITRAIDGDTVVADLDLGWKITYHAKVRLSGINCPEMDTPEGQVAAQFTSSKLWDLTLAAGPLERGRFMAASVTVVSHSLDKYGRVLGDIFYNPPDTAKGLVLPLTAMVNLNQQILDAGHAVVMR